MCKVHFLSTQNTSLSCLKFNSEMYILSKSNALCSCRGIMHLETYPAGKLNKHTYCTHHSPISFLDSANIFLGIISYNVYLIF